MKRFKIFSILVIMLAAVVTVHAGELKVSEKLIEYGTIKEGAPVVKTLMLTNTGDSDLVIFNVATSCACTKTQIDKTRLGPDESAELRITYITFKYAGKFDKTVTIACGPEGRDETVIHLRGYVEAIPMGVIELSPRKVDVGELPLDQDSPVSIVIKNTGDADLTISRIVSKKFGTVYFDAEKTGDIIISAGGGHEISVVIHPKSPGRFLDIIMIYSDARNDVGNGYKAVLSGQVNE